MAIRLMEVRTKTSTPILTTTNNRLKGSFGKQFWGNKPERSLKGNRSGIFLVTVAANPIHTR